MDHVNQAQTKRKPNGQASSIALENTLKGVLGKPTTIEHCQVSIGCAEVEFHELDQEEDGGHDFWGYTKMLTGQGGQAVCYLIITLGKVFTSYNQGVVALA